MERVPGYNKNGTELQTLEKKTRNEYREHKAAYIQNKESEREREREQTGLPTEKQSGDHL
jgi:hypothetical protein